MVHEEHFLYAVVFPPLPNVLSALPASLFSLRLSVSVSVSLGVCVCVCMCASLFLSLSVHAIVLESGSSSHSSHYSPWKKWREQQTDSVFTKRLKIRQSKSTRVEQH